MREYKLPHNVLDKLANYLAKKPYIEVTGLIQALTQLKEIKEPKEKEEEPKKA